MASQWIIGRREDLVWLIGSAGAGFALYGVYLLLTSGLALDNTTVLLVLFALWALVFDGTHAFATYARTYCDRQFRVNYAPLLWGSLLVFLVGPALFSAFWLFGGNETARGFSIVFNRFALTFAYYHQVRQHWGFVTAYRRKAGETNILERRLDAALLGFGLTYPFLYHHIHYFQPLYAVERLTVGMQTWREVVSGLWLVAAVALVAAGALSLAPGLRRAVKPIGVTGVLCGVAGWVTISMVDFGINAALRVAFLLTLAGFVVTLVVYAVALWRRPESVPVSRPKLLLFGVLLVTYNFFLLIPLPTLVPLMCLTIFHNIQYHRMVRFYNVNVYTEDHAAERNGLAATLTRKLAVFGVLALAWSFLIVAPRSAAEMFLASEPLKALIGGLFWGAAFHHYYLDAVIWRLRSPELARNLRLAPAAVPAAA